MANDPVQQIGHWILNVRPIYMIKALTRISVDIQVDLAPKKALRNFLLFIKSILKVT